MICQSRRVGSPLKRRGWNGSSVGALYKSTTHLPKRKSNEVEWKGRKFREKVGSFGFEGGRRKVGKGARARRRGTTQYPQGKGRTAQGMIGVALRASGGGRGRQEGSDL